MWVCNEMNVQGVICDWSPNWQNLQSAMSNNSIASNVNEISVQSEEEIQMLPNAKTRQTKVSFKENRYVKSDAEKILLSWLFGGVHIV